MWIISKKNQKEPKEATLINNVHVKRIYTFHPFCRNLRILLRDFRGVGPNYYDITWGGIYRDPQNVIYEWPLMFFMVSPPALP